MVVVDLVVTGDGVYSYLRVTGVALDAGCRAWTGRRQSHYGRLRAAAELALYVNHLEH